MKAKSLLTIVLITGVFSATSCKKKTDPAPTTTPTSSTSPYFIEGKVDGVMHKATYVCQIPGCSESAGNYDDFMNWIRMYRNTAANNPIGWDILIDNVTLSSWQVPDTLDASTYSYNENLQLSYYKGPHQSSNNYLVDAALGDSSFKMYVTSKAGDVIQGTFSGTLRNGDSYSDTVKVTEGKFKIKIVRR